MIPAKNYRAREWGVTLIELLTVVAIVAILATVSVASYRSYILRAKRAEAKSALLRVQVAEEKFFIQNNTYTDQLTAASPTGLGFTSTTPQGNYTVDVKGNPDLASSFIVTATATSTNGQDKDTKCATFTITDQGVRTPDDSTGCWR